MRSVLLKVNPNMSVVQMLPDHFKEFSKHSGVILYNSIPFASVTSLKFERSRADEVTYKTSFDEEYHTIVLKKKVVKLNDTVFNHNRLILQHK